MSKGKVLLIAVGVLLILSLSAWIYWETPLSLADRLPQERWVSLEFAVGDPGIEEYGIQPPALEAVLDAIGETRVSRYSELEGLYYPYFRLLLYKGEAYPTLLYVQKNGWITLAEGLDFDHSRYYEGGEELYRALMELVAE